MSLLQRCAPVLALLLLAAAPVAAQPAMSPQPAPTPAGPAASPAGSISLPEIPPGPPLSLARALELADDQNLSLAAIRASLRQADAQLALSRSALFPVVNAGATFTHLDYETETTLAPGMSMVTRKQNDLAASLQVTLPLVSPQAWVGVDVARQSQRVAELSYASARQQLLLGVALAYYQTLTARSLITMYEAQVGSVSQHLDVAETRVRAGLGRRAEVLRPRGELLSIQEQLLAAHASLANARDSLAVLTGTKEPPLPVEEAPLQAPRQSGKELWKRAEQQREDLRVQEARTALAERQLDQSWMQFVPTLGASWQLSYQISEPAPDPDADPSRWAAYLTLSVPLYNQTRYADLELKRAAIAVSKLEAANARREARLELTKARRDYETAVLRARTAQDQAALARETLTVTQTEYAAGTGSSLSVTDARRTLREVEVNLAARRLEAQMALLSLLRAVGEDLHTLAGGGPPS